MTVPEARIDRRQQTLLQALGLTREEAQALGRYEVGSEPSEPPTRPNRSGRPAQYRHPPEVDEILKKHLLEAKAGVPDKSIARASGLSTAQVQRWRLRHGIRRLHPTNRQRGHAAAIAMFGRCSLPIAMGIESRVNGTWEPPEYMVRFPIEYSDFVALVATLVDAGFTPTRIAKGLGVRHQDVVTAVQLHAEEAA